MARSIPVIYNQLLTAKNAQSNLNTQLTSTSQVSIWNLWLWITAVGQNLFEQLCDLFTINIETLIANAPVFTPQWIVQMCKNYQYSAANPQLLQLNASAVYPYLSIGYPVVNTSLCPVAQAAVVSSINHELIIKVTGSSGPLDGTPGVTTGPICSGLASYLNQILTPDTQYQIINDAADQIFIQAEIFYNASYSGVIQANVQAAFTNYFASIPFNGVVMVSAIEEAVLAVPGVTDIILNNVYYRTTKNTGTPSGGTPPTNAFYATQMLVNNNTLILRSYPTYAGYVVTEQTSGYQITSPGILTYYPS
jgi:hypothetical protein